MVPIPSRKLNLQLHLEIPKLKCHVYGHVHVHVQKHGKCSNIQILPLKHPVDLLINIIYYNLCQRSSTSKARRLHAVLAKIHGLRHGPCMHPCTNLDLLVIGQNVFTTARFNICIDATKKNLNPSTLELVTQSISKMSPRFAPIKNFLILTLHTPRETLY